MSGKSEARVNTGSSCLVSECRGVKSQYIQGLFLTIILLVLFSRNVCAQSKADSVTAPLDDYRHFIMPTGKPIHGGYFGFWELAFLQGGFGLGDIFSFSGGITIMPIVAF